MSIRFRLALVIGGVALSVAAAFSLAAYQATRSAELRLGTERLESAAARIVELLDASLTSALPELETLAADPALAEALAGSGARTETDVVARLSRLSGDSLVAEVLDPAGSLRVTTHPERSRRVAHLRADLISYVRGGDDRYAGPLAVVEGQLLLPRAVPVLQGSDTLGWVAVWQGPGVNESGRAALEGLVGSGASVRLVNRDGSLWTDLQTAQAPVPISLDSAGVRVFRDGAGRERLGGVAALAHAPWVVVAIRPLEKVLEPARATLRRLLSIGAVLVLLALVGGWYLSGSLSRPLLRLSRAARKVSEGDLDIRVSSSRSDEMGVLESAFDSMAEAMSRSRAELDARIDQLTASRREAREAHERLERVLAASGSVLYRLERTPGGERLLWISGSLRGLLGHDASEALEPGWWRRVVHPDDAALMESWGRVSSGEAVVRHYRVRHADGGYRWIRDEQRPASDAGSGAQAVGTWHDVTRQRDLEDQLRQAQKLEAVGRLAGGVAHDFNNILTVVLGETEEALEALGEDDGEARDSVEAVRRAALSASQLTRQLLAFSRNDLPDPALLRPDVILLELQGMLGRLVGEQIDLSVRSDPDVGWVRADRGQLEQVVVNFVVNARDAMPEGGRIVLGASNVELDGAYADARVAVEPGSYVALSVTDHGIGMSDEVKGHLFEPFFTTKPAGEGTGLGLATCWAIARNWGGSISVYSEVGVGTTVRLYLPRAAPPGGGGPLPEAVPERGGDETILVVEDDDMVRATTERILARLGYRVRTATNGTGALEVLEREGPVDLVLTDLVMPGMGGRELAAVLRELRPETPVLFLSGYTDDTAVRAELLDRGAALLHKPYTRDQLDRKIREMLEA